MRSMASRSASSVSLRDAFPVFRVRVHNVVGDILLGRFCQVCICPDRAERRTGSEEPSSQFLAL